MEFQLPKGLLLGVATASMQIEGGQLDTNWHDWYRQGKIKDNTDPATANHHWQRWREDTLLLKQMGMKLYRFSIEWARIVPVPGQVDEAAIARYRQEQQLLTASGIRPLMTLHHFSNPMWFEKMGGFTKRKNLHYYLEFVQLAAERFGDLVSEYIPINEPNVYAASSFLAGSWPPGKKSLLKTAAVYENLAYCHIRAYQILHETRTAMGYRDTMVGTAHHLRPFTPKNEKNPWHRLAARLSEWLFQTALLQAMNLGKFPLPLRNFGKLPRGEYSDFNGLNYYTRTTVSGIGDGVREGSPQNDLDWEVYPQGLAECAEKLDRILRRPIWVTENGTCDNKDSFRCRYLYDHLKVLSQSSLPFARYYHWCFCDNLEWLEGNSAKFGLVAVNPESGERTVKNSGHFYAEIIQNHGVTQEMHQKYVAGQAYNIR